MAFQVSPGISISEIDLTTIVPSVSSTEGAFAGVFAWGPVNTPVLVSSELNLINRFGPPITNFNDETFFVAADFLSYGSKLYVSRADNGLASNATVSVAANTIIDVSAKYPGEFGNSIDVVITGKSAYAAATSGIKNLTLREPETTTKVHIAVIDRGGKFTGSAGALLEKFENVSLTSGTSTLDGANNYFIDVINNRSEYIQFIESSLVALNTSLLDLADLTITLTGGTNGASEANVSVGLIQAAYDVYKSAENIDISLIMAGKSIGTNGTQIANYLVDNIAEVRKDCVVFASPQKSDVVEAGNNALTNVKTFSGSLSNSSYLFVDNNYKYRYDKYNDRYVWGPVNGDMAGLCVRTDDTRDPWFSPAGYNRGNIKNCIRLAWNPDKGTRDELYKVDVNSVISQPGQGTLLFGDKTHLGRDSAFDRINVRRLFIVLEKAIARAAKGLLFEFNDEFTRARFKNMVEPFLRNVQGRRGIHSFRVVADETNNTPTVIDRNEFIGDIYVKPARSINTIQLNFIAVRTGVEFEEVVGRE